MRIEIPCGFRKPMRLTRTSAHVHLSSLGFQSGKQQSNSIESALECLGDAFRSHNFEDVYRSEVALAHGDGTVVQIRLSSANMRVPGHDGHDSGVMADSVPAG
jgi:hypothetical protein